MFKGRRTFLCQFMIPHWLGLNFFWLQNWHNSHGWKQAILEGKQTLYWSRIARLFLKNGRWLSVYKLWRRKCL